MLKVPKELRANLRYRSEILKLGSSSKLARDEIRLACERDPIFFIDTFLFGFNPKDESELPERPFITYPFQEDLVHKLEAAIGRHDLLVPKSRAVGGTYIILGKLFHRWMFRRMQSFLLCSAKEDRVDRKGDPSCLFWKVDHFLNCLPGWLRPEYDRVELKLENLQTGSVFNGESTNQNVDRGGRRTAILADEAAAMRDTAKIASSIQHVTNCCIWLSTFQGAFGTFYDLYDKYSRESPDWVVKLHWSQHPFYSQGLYLDNDGKARSPWYDTQCLRAPGPRWIAQELDMEPMAAGGQFFENDLLTKLIKQSCRRPTIQGELRYDELGQNPKFTPSGYGKLLLWCPVDKEGRPPPGEYIAGHDIATGKGGEQSSQSTISVVNKETGEKVAEYKNNTITPTNFAKYAAAVGHFFYGAKLIWGSQGLGDFGATLHRECKYGRVYVRENGKPGFVETPDSKYQLFSAYRDALAVGRFVNRSEEALNECRQFIYANGTVEHSRAIQSDQDPENAGRLHGDIVVADAMACFLLPTLESVRRNSVVGEPAYGTFAWRMREAERAHIHEGDWDREPVLSW